MIRDAARFVRGGRVVEAIGLPPSATLLDYLRGEARSTGAKRGCDHHSCGACTVALGRLSAESGIRYEAAHACSLLLTDVDGCEVVTAEDIADHDGTLHPVQAALAEKHGALCGYCTPGIVMSLFALHSATSGPIDRGEAAAALQGNLCRCTGYRSLVDAAVAAAEGPRSTRQDRIRATTAATLTGLADADHVVIGVVDRFVAAPATLEGVFGLLAEQPGLTIRAGGTAQSWNMDARVVSLARIRALRQISHGPEGLTLGGGATLSAARHALHAFDPDLATLVDRIGSPQIRTVATVGGNIAARSPWGDLQPVLLALDGSVVLASAGETRTVAAAAFFGEDGHQDRFPGEIIQAVVIPPLGLSSVFRTSKVARRTDLSAATIVGAFHFALDVGRRLTDVRIAFNGLGPGPRRANGAEEVLTGSEALDRSTWSKAFAALRADFSPAGDRLGSARYRIETAQALLGKALIETGSGSDHKTRLRGYREPIDAG